MIGLGFIIRALQFCLYFAVGATLLWLVIYVVSLVIQLTARAIGHEIGNFGTWFFGLFKKKQK